MLLLLLLVLVTALLLLDPLPLGLCLRLFDDDDCCFFEVDDGDGPSEEARGEEAEETRGDADEDAIEAESAPISQDDQAILTRARARWAEVQPSEQEQGEDP